jgi:hypothetical protein
VVRLNLRFPHGDRLIQSTNKRDTLQERDNESDFQPEAVDASESSFVVEPPDTPATEAAITWRWATAADMPALRICHFQSEVMAGQELYLPDRSSDQRVIAIAEKDGKVIGGLFAEDSVIVTMIGLERSVAESAYDSMIATILTLARNEGTRLVEVRLPCGVKFDLQTGAELGREKPTQ